MKPTFAAYASAGNRRGGGRRCARPRVCGKCCRADRSRDDDQDPYNNTDTSKTPSNIYPVLTTGTSSSSLWLQAWLKVPKGEMGNKPYPKLNNFRIYINPTGKGIPPGGSVTITLPLLTQLFPPIGRPKETDQYIDWWGGGRVELFEAPAENG